MNALITQTIAIHRQHAITMKEVSPVHATKDFKELEHIAWVNISLLFEVTK